MKILILVIGPFGIMRNIENIQEQIINVEQPFTELFSLLKRYENLPDGNTTLVYSCDELKTIHHHTDNVINVLLQGLQSLSQMIGFVSPHKVIHELNYLAFFISAISNLTEALNVLRSDADYILSERQVSNY